MTGMSDTELIFLDNLIYLNFANIVEDYKIQKSSLTIGKLIDEILTDIDECAKGDPAHVPKEDWKHLLEMFRDNPENWFFLNSYCVDLENYKNEDAKDGAFRAFCFIKKDDNDEIEDVVAIFRGTAGDAIEWEDNFMNACRLGSDQMDKSVDFINNLPQEYGTNITVSGHSKGGNRSQYVTILTDRIGRCLSFDGQGFSSEFIEQYADVIEERKNIITSISVQYDYVNVLLEPIAGTIKYIPVPCDEDYTLNHCPNKPFTLDEIEYRDFPSFPSTLISLISEKILESFPDVTIKGFLEIVCDIIVPALAEDATFDGGELIYDSINYKLDKIIAEQEEECSGSSYYAQSVKEIINDQNFRDAVSNLPQTIFDFYSQVGNNITNIIEDLDESISNIPTDYNKNHFFYMANKLVLLYHDIEKFNRRYGIDIKYDLTKLPQFINEELKLIDKYEEYLKNYSFLLVNKSFSSSLDDNEIKILNELFDIFGKYHGEDKSFDMLRNQIYNVLNIKNNAATAAFDPLVIDMGKTGFELTDVENGVNFDMDANGFAEKTGWITGDDAFLALDRNGNGIIDNGGELFGDRTLLSNGTYAASGFEALAEFDSNLDRLINAHDEVYRQLRLWQDKNHDGICTPDELMTLEEAGISAINLNYESMNKTDDATGSVLSNISSVVFDDGTETAVGEFKFNADKIDTKDIINFELSEEILSLPNVRAIGGVHSLHYAMAMDETGTLQSIGSSYVDARYLAVVL